MVQSLIRINSENNRNFEVIYLTGLKLSSRIQFDTLEPLFTLNVKYLHHVTRFHFCGPEKLALVKQEQKRESQYYTL